MITDTRIDASVNHDLLSFLKNIRCTTVQFKILFFLGRHPRSRLSFYTVAKALDAARLDLRNAMTALVEQGILTERRDSGLTTYALAYDERINVYMDELAKLDLARAIYLRKQLESETRTV
jgi:DNA-binding transcriptional ArsR family regulator